MSKTVTSVRSVHHWHPDQLPQLGNWCNRIVNCGLQGHLKTRNHCTVSIAAVTTTTTAASWMRGSGTIIMMLHTWSTKTVESQQIEQMLVLCTDRIRPDLCDRKRMKTIVECHDYYGMTMVACAPRVLVSEQRSADVDRSETDARQSMLRGGREW